MKPHVMWTGPGAPPTDLERRLIQAALNTHKIALIQKQGVAKIMDRLFNRDPPKAPPTLEDANAAVNTELTMFVRYLFSHLTVTFTIEQSDFA